MEVNSNKQVTEDIVDNHIKDQSIIWFKSSNNEIHCGRVDDHYPKTRTVWVFNYNAWTHWLIPFDDIIRVDVSYYTDKYRKWDLR